MAGSPGRVEYGKMLMFARALPLIRAGVDADLRRHGLPCERVLAAILRLLELTLFRVGNREYSRTNGSFGLTTLRDRHAQIQGNHIHLSFRGKSGVRNESDINDPRVARIVKACRELPGYELFQYLDDAGERRTISSPEVKRLFARHHRRGYNRQGFPYMGRHEPGRTRAVRI